MAATLVAVAFAFSATPAHADERAGGTRIVGGTATTVGEWPWQVAIAEPPSSGRNGFQRQFCGGTLVAPTIVITAAHCVWTFTAFPLCTPLDGFDTPASEFSVITGRTTLSSNEGQEIPVAEIYYFEAGPNGTAVATAQSAGDGRGLYECETSRWDAVFLRLASPSSSQPIKIAGPNESAAWAPGRTAFITGWGATSESGPRSDTLQEAQIRMISDAFCSQSSVYGPGSGFTFDPQTMVCAGEEAGGRDTCQGDSGGPLVVPLDGAGFRLVGDTSFGEGCARPNKPGVYGRVAANPMRAAFRDGILAVAGVDVVGDTTAPPPGQQPSNQYQIGKLNGTRLSLTVPGPGQIRVADAKAAGKRLGAKPKKRLKPSSATAGAAGTVTVKLKLTRRAKRIRRQTGRAKVRAAITFTPSGGTANTQIKKLTVKR